MSEGMRSTSQMGNIERGQKEMFLGSVNCRDKQDSMGEGLRFNQELKLAKAKSNLNKLKH